MKYVLALRPVGVSVDCPLSFAESEALQAAMDQLDAHRITADDCWRALDHKRKYGAVPESDLWAFSVWEAAEEAAQLVLDSMNVKGTYRLDLEPHPTLRLA